MYSQHQAQYFAWQLTRRLDSEDEDKLTGAIMDAQIDLNPHQVDAALFAFRNPLSNGVILADEVGLGKTIEAGLVIAQKWAERKRRILIVVPANLRKQWHQELQEKFGVDGLILEGDSYKTVKKEGVKNPFDAGEKIVICSYQFAKAKADDIQMIPWDLAVIDEAHRLRNVYKKGKKIAAAIRDALSSTFKVMLTATPLQNSLLELFGMVSIIDEKVFGDLDSFRIKYGRLNDNLTFNELRKRIKPVCKRTLRKDVEAYVPYTKRIAMVEEFTPSSDEQKLYWLVSAYLQRSNLNALPSGQRQLISMVMWKLLASSSFAIAGALNSIINRLENDLKNDGVGSGVYSDLNADYESLDETAEEWSDDEDSACSSEKPNRQSIIDEINELKSFKELAENIRENSKGEVLLKALKIAFEKLKELGAQEKAIIFTESRKTQDYLFELLGNSEYKDGILLFNGTNSDSQAKEIYKNWLVKHEGSDKITGSKTADTRAALVEYFKEKGKIMIATEAAAEGVNLQFCSLVINYDLPWNPQRMEQRIGRCHRYGQKHDVVVLNFIDSTNPADQRVHELLKLKFKIFDGVFGASDEVLGAIENGVDFERRIKKIYDTCRDPEEIKSAFDKLQQDLAHEINAQMINTREQLFENFDEDVLQRLKIDTEASLDKYEQMLLALTQTELSSHFQPVQGGFVIKSLPSGAPANIPTGEYELPRRDGDCHLYRLKHPLAQWTIDNAKSKSLGQAHLVFNTDARDTKVSVVEELRGQTGQLQVCRVTVESMERAEDHLAVIGINNKGEVVHSDVLEKLLSYPVKSDSQTTFSINPTIEKELSQAKQELLSDISQRNLKYFEAEVEKLDAWADDLKVVLEQNIKETDREIREVRRTAKLAPDLHEKLHWQKKQKELEKLRHKKRRELFDRQDEVDEGREVLITELEDKMNQTVEEQMLFSITWEVV
ncbi:SNF2-related protein [Photorhabdus temperata]|uniref:DEAD/DEAH box helicase n=1 Tax=Photorhabdus temperata J3 TaxID=1389415 RepID=U7QZU0_PHOTE|nr:SNF2-related protein [Photorhabdus temperata]ERT12051.1 DEAD/DEAH box helicase [Photorhabdus temperata J3]